MASATTLARRILVVDDDPLVADSLRRMLEFDGHQVEVAGGAQQALALFAKGAFELTMLDYEMPGMKGDQLAAALKAIAPDHPVIMFTGYAEAVAAASAPLKGVDLVLGKPFHLEDLRRALARFCPPLQR